MGKRSGVPHRDDELAALSLAGLEAELARAHSRLTIVEGAKAAKQWHKRIHWLEAEIARRD
ncbi:hypothetical protein HNP52_004137 [Sphingomonas kyeonggiensis]|uniref:Uncharacterized protein n=1 Tax=Sphingomonas kyeonggiensis TaxID=1268553 RepID=A0A7W7NT87_9SPHN|nr:hypothetical protein [Sphingomonas kyeonggiensis]MBB4841040.1 hypothetical protein [Sphingomonas kyeonggiensis]